MDFRLRFLVCMFLFVWRSMASVRSVSTVLRMGEVAYYVGPVAPSDAIADDLQFEPCTVFYIDNSLLTSSFLVSTVKRFAHVDDVWSNDFRATIVLQSEGKLEIEDAAREILQQWKTLNIHYLIREKYLSIPEGPYFLNAGKLHYAYRLYPDTHAAFVVATVESNEPNRYKALDAAAYGERNPSALTVAVPSRLRYTRTLDKPFSGARLAVKDIMHLEGLKTTGGSRAYTELYGEKKRGETADIIQKLIDLGFVIVGKVKTTQFADSEWPTCDYVDYHGPFNPRGDGYLTPSGSSSGSASAVAAYGWLDFALGTDTLGSIRSPAAAQGLYSMRPTVGAASFKGIIPYSPHWDTPAGFARDAKSFALLASAMYGHGIVPDCSKKPTRLLVPSDYWPVSDMTSQSKFDSLVNRIEKYLGIKRTTIKLAQAWKDSNYEGTDESIEDYFHNVFAWSASPDQWNGFLKGFLDEYQSKFGKAAILHPQVRFKRDWLPSITTNQQEEALRRLQVYRDWFYEHVMPPSKDGCPESLLVLPWTDGKPDYRDKYRDGPQNFTGEGFFFYNVGPYANAPEIMVPAGTTTYPSPLSGVNVQLPAGISIIAPTGTDVMLARLVADMMAEYESEPDPSIMHMSADGKQEVLV
ncbi:putative glutamyl-tRNA amidotransferase subunit A [Hypoxylon rubiginosum]|uniref:Glutamyl-tRNA amidotransferase subunit A n=1 Tax=Hypoxylon rubiginosum TaxID=110542 RepID=A0ACC0DGM7_9PEZI|nr:putative glutamyl-tRNA amidotransferase subunit A [Hypoxylon rubiginosum]